MSKEGRIPHWMRITLMGIAGIVLVLVLFSLKSLFQNVGASEIVVIQSPFSGKLNVYSTEGVKFQGFGHVTIYQKTAQIDCVFEDDQGRTRESYDPLPIRFNDAGKANMAVSMRWEMPLMDSLVVSLHRTYGSQEAIERDLVLRTLERSVYNTGPLYSSRESYAEKRANLLSSLDDQTRYGVYQTIVRSEKRRDPLTGEERTVDVIELIPNTVAPGGFERQTKSPLDKFGVQVTPGTLTINRVDYDEKVMDQINAQQQAIMRVQTAIAEAKEAEQKALTVAEQGKANAAKAKWEQEVKKAELVTAAEAARDVAALKKQEAEFYKQAQTLRGEGDGAYKRLVMQADGALAAKLTTYEKVNAFYADAIAKSSSNWVPSIVMGAEGGSYSGAQALIEMLNAKVAKDLSLDMSVPGGK